MILRNVDMDRTINCCIVGDGMVGKSSIVKSFVGQTAPGSYVATISDNYSGDVSITGVHYTVSISDSTGEVSFNCYRNLKYLQRSLNPIILNRYI